MSDFIYIFSSFISFFSSILLLFSFKNERKKLTTLQKVSIIILVFSIWLPFFTGFFFKHKVKNMFYFYS
ncbi:hypothetical protein IGK20_002065 [Enterococcus sp. AZ112]